jgi:hypothetical protein
MNRHFRSRRMLDMAYQFPCALHFHACEGGDSGEPAHSNQEIHGKGGSIKAHDCFHVPACRSCHRELDQGRTMDRETKAWTWNRAFGLYLPRLLEQML